MQIDRTRARINQCNVQDAKKTATANADAANATAEEKMAAAEKEKEKKIQVQGDCPRFLPTAFSLEDSSELLHNLNLKM